MSKRFCVTGTRIPAKNYMVDISDRVDIIIHDYIDKGQYFYHKPCQTIWKNDHTLYARTEA